MPAKYVPKVLPLSAVYQPPLSTAVVTVAGKRVGLAWPVETCRGNSLTSRRSRSTSEGGRDVFQFRVFVCVCEPHFVFHLSSHDTGSSGLQAHQTSRCVNFCPGRFLWVIYLSSYTFFMGSVGRVTTEVFLGTAFNAKKTTTPTTKWARRQYRPQVHSCMFPRSLACDRPLALGPRMVLKLPMSKGEDRERGLSQANKPAVASPDVWPPYACARALSPQIHGCARPHSMAPRIAQFRKTTNKLMQRNYHLRQRDITCMYPMSPSHIPHRPIEA